MKTPSDRLRDAVRDVMDHQWSHNRTAMQALTDLVDAANSGADEINRLRAALEIIAAPRRPDGTFNRDRNACQRIAKDALGYD